MEGAKLFNYFESREKIGKEVRVVNDFRGITRGTKGKVVRTEQMLDAFCVAIVWNDLREPTTTDILTKYEYENFLEEFEKV